jgi:hypothetical protein
MDSQPEIEDIFEDGLLTVFGDVKVSHGEPGQVFSYATQTHRYLQPWSLSFANPGVQHHQSPHSHHFLL